MRWVKHSGLMLSRAAAPPPSSPPPSPASSRARSALAPFWMLNDAEARGWEQRGTLLPVLSLIPVLGPAIYLLLRPKTDMSQ